MPTILCVIDGDDGSLKRSYIYSGAQPIAFYEGDYTDPAYIYLHDRLGSVRQVLDSAGNVKNTYTYTPFGTDPNSQFSETVDNPFRFTGQWYDGEIDQYYLRARQYEPVIMRLTSIDPVFGKPDRPLTLHPYLYCRNDSINYIDPDGRWAIVIGGSLSGNLTASSFSGISGNIGHVPHERITGGALDKIIGYHYILLPGFVVASEHFGVAGTAGAGFAVAKESGTAWNKGWSFGTMQWVAGGGSFSSGPGAGLTADFAFSLGAQTVKDLGGRFKEVGGSVTIKAPILSLFFGQTIGFSYARGDSGTDLYTASWGGGCYSWTTGWEGHVYRGGAIVQEW